MAFPPIPSFPIDIDSDRTLFLVYNTTETKLSANNAAWSQQVDIYPVAADESEIWADNGFATISGEMFYYDSVDKNDDGKVYRLKGCARQLSGEASKHNNKGTWVRGFVVAEHHNQLVDTLLAIEDFVGIDFDTRQETLDWRIRNLQGLPVIYDDYACPDVNFTFNIIEDDKETGILASYDIEVSTPSLFTSFRLDFGDGEFTTTVLSGTHRYAINSVIDPVITLTNDKCQLVQTPIERDNPAEPAVPITTIFDLPIPEFPDIPDITFVPCVVPEPDIYIPPLVQPCIEATDFPSISIGDIQIPSTISIISDFPSVVIFDGPSIIVIDPPINPTIVIDPPIPPTLVVVIDSSVTIGLDANTMPLLQVDWGPPPELTVQVAMPKIAKSKPVSLAQGINNEFGTEYADIFQAEDTMTVEMEEVGFPSTIQIVAPDQMPMIEIDTTPLKSMKVELIAPHIPDIKIQGPDSPIPNEISIVGREIPKQIEIVCPTQIEIIGEIPKTIRVESDLPRTITIETPRPIPDRILVESNLPEFIDIRGFPTSIPITMPEIPRIELFYSGAPVEMKVSFEDIIAKDGEGQNCFYMVPCGKSK